MLVSDLTVIEFFGLQALALVLFYVAAMALRIYDPKWPIAAKIQYGAGMFFLAGLPAYLGLTVIFPGLPII